MDCVVRMCYAVFLLLRWFYGSRVQRFNVQGLIAFESFYGFAVSMPSAFLCFGHAGSKANSLAV